MEVNCMSNLLKIKAHSLTTLTPAARELIWLIMLNRSNLIHKESRNILKKIGHNIKQRSTLLPFKLPGETYRDPALTRIFL